MAGWIFPLMGMYCLVDHVKWPRQRNKGVACVLYDTWLTWVEAGEEGLLVGREIK